MSTERLADGAPLPDADLIEELDRVVVVGAGPVGLCTAVTLARAGVAVTVLEKGSGLSAESRASTFHPPTLELLDQLGLVDPVLDRGLRAPTTQFRDRRSGPIAEFDLTALAGQTEYPFRIQLEQNKFAEIVLERIRTERLDVDVRFGWRTHGVIEQTGDRVRLLAGTIDGNVEVRAPWVIGADGAHSAVRSSLGIDLLGEAYPERFLVASVDEAIETHLEHLAYVNYVADPDEWLVLLRTPDHWRVLFPVTADDGGGDDNEADERADEAFTEDDLQRRLTAVVDLGRPWNVLQWSLYVVSRRVAARMRDGRVLLAGDAAHQNSPLGGMGMNSGIQDGVSAGRRLASVIAGEADDSVLDEYDRLRREIATDYVQRDSHANWLALREPDPGRRSRLQAELRETAADPRRHRERMERTAMLDAVRDHL